MSQVYQRNRSEAESSCFDLAMQIRVETTRLLKRENVVPKSYRLFCAVPAAETARSIVYNVNRAYQFYPNTSYNVIERRKYLSLAIADCEQLMQDFQCLIAMGVAKPAQFEGIAQMVSDEIGKLKSKRKNTRLMGASVDERIAAARDEIARLEEVGRL